MPEVEIQIEQFRGMWFGECLIDWNDSQPPHYRLISKPTEQAVRRVCETIRRFVEAYPPEPVIDWFAENPVFVPPLPDPAILPTDPPLFL